jgi:acyl-coenzyme A thioesterase PaaI-like protein
MSSDENRPWPDDETLADLVAHAAGGGWRGGDAYAHMHEAHRRAQDALAGAAPPPDVCSDVARRLDEITDALGAYQVPERERFDGWRPDLPGRGEPLLPPYVIEAESDQEIRGRVTFSRFHLGGNGAAHGGTPPLLFDDVLGKVVNFHHHEGVSRTAFLKVNYRQVVPLGVELRFDAQIDNVDGRKKWASARLVDPDGTVLADAEALFVKLRPDQR